MSKNGQDYSQKYKELRANFLSATERAYSVGYEHGMRDAAQQQMQQQQEQQMQMAQMAAQQPQDQQETPEQDVEQQDFAQQADESQLDQQETEFESALNELEQLLGGGEEVDKAETAKAISSIMKSLSSIRDIKGRIELRKSMTLQPMHKSERLKALGKKIKTESINYKHNVDAHKKQAVTMQKQMVNSLVEKMRKEETSALDQIVAKLTKQGVVK